jgi:hypothetical protein
MEDTPARLFFLQPTNDTQRLYEALHAVFVDGSLQKEVAQRFGYPFDAFRQQVHQFRTRCASGQPPPFSAPGRGAGRRLPPAHRGNPNSLLSRIAAPGT